jgi:hypothetical protein
MRKKNSYKVGVLGLSEVELLMLKSLERILRIRVRPYAFEPDNDGYRDIYLINGDDAAAMERWQMLRKQTAAPAILVCQSNQCGESDRNIKRPLVAARLLRMLDEITGQQDQVSTPSLAN